MPPSPVCRRSSGSTRRWAPSSGTPSSAPPSRLVTGPSATVAAVSFSVVGLLAAAAGPNSAEWIGYTAALAVMVGIVYLALGLLKMGWISNFLSKAVLEGFIFAFGIGLIVDQSHKILGVPKVDGSYWNVLVGTLRRSRRRTHTR